MAQHTMTPLESLTKPFFTETTCSLFTKKAAIVILLVLHIFYVYSAGIKREFIFSLSLAMLITLQVRILHTMTPLESLTKPFFTETTCSLFTIIER